jgi:hypothetical protein
MFPEIGLEGIRLLAACPPNRFSGAYSAGPAQQIRKLENLIWPWVGGIESGNLQLEIASIR